MRSRWMRVAAGLAAMAWGTTAGAAEISIGTTSGVAGADVQVAVTLRTMGALVLGTQNRIDFDRVTPIAAHVDGNPDCAANPAIDKNATGFRFLPLGCDPAVDCASVRVFVISFENLDPIPDDSVLYQCHVAIAADATPGTHALQIAEVSASAAGGQLVDTTGVDGEVQVVETPPTPTATTTATVTATVAATPSSPPTATETPTPLPSATPTPPACVGDCNGDFSVSINELLTGVNIVIGAAPTSSCLGLDVNGDGSVVINEIIQAVNNALNACPAL